MDLENLGAPLPEINGLPESNDVMDGLVLPQSEETVDTYAGAPLTENYSSEPVDENSVEVSEAAPLTAPEASEPVEEEKVVSTDLLAQLKEENERRAEYLDAIRSELTRKAQLEAEYNELARAAVNGRQM